LKVMSWQRSHNHNSDTLFYLISSVWLTRTVMTSDYFTSQVTARSLSLVTRSSGKPIILKIRFSIFSIRSTTRSPETFLSGQLTSCNLVQSRHATEYTCNSSFISCWLRSSFPNYCISCLLFLTFSLVFQYFVC